ncbi:hypothetical protein Tco_1207128 [Tanacetum coccineum]
MVFCKFNTLGRFVFRHVIKNAPYYNAYLEMVAKHDQKVAAKKEGKKKSASTKQPKPKPAIEKSSKLAPAPKPKVTKEKPSKASTGKPPKPKPAKEKSTKATPLQTAGKGKFEEFDMERAIQMSLESFQAQGHAHVGATEEASTGPSVQPQDDTSANIIRDSPSLADAETGDGSDKTNRGGDTEIFQINEELGEDVEKQVDLEEKTAELDQDQAGSDPGKTHESQPLPEHVLMYEDQARPDPGVRHMALARPHPEPTHDEFIATLYPKVQESLKCRIPIYTS